MNDLPQNELFSAYLDGELTAAEQAEMERLLATDPAARQLLDELRALSSTLQALPQEKLGEDLSRQVLRVAQRRMLAEGGPGETESAPVPLARSIFRRFLTRRTLVWLSLTAAIAAMITINERRQGLQPAADGGREVALAPAKPESRAREPGPPPSIRARDEDDYARKGAEALVEKEPAGARPAGAAPLAEAPAAAPAATMPAGKPADRSVLVVRCDISPEAAKKRAFENLLDANGVAWRRQRDGSLRANAKQEEAKKNEAGAYMDSVASNVAPEVDLIYMHVDATPAQIQATLTGMQSQPNVFLAVSVKPAEDKLSREVVRQFAAEGRALRKSGIADAREPLRAKVPAGAATKDVKTEAESQDRPATFGAAPPTTLEFQQRVQAGGPSAGRGAVGQLDVTMRERTQSQPSVQSPPRQQVLFVLRIVGADRPAASSPVRGK